MTPPPAPVAPQGRRGAPPRRRRGAVARSGLTILEVLVAMPIVLIAASMIASTLLAGARQRAVNRDNAIAADAVRAVFENMRNEDFLQVFALYNAEPFDDPGGPGTAPGNRLDVSRLQPVPEALDGAVLEVLFPVLDTGGAIDPHWELREDAPFPRLGTPRDLNGDGLVDDQDHAADYRLLPVAVVARWTSVLGPREFRMQTLLADWSASS